MTFQNDTNIIAKQRNIMQCCFTLKYQTYILKAKLYQIIGLHEEYSDNNVRKI